MKLYKDSRTGYYTRFTQHHELGNVHDPRACWGRGCAIHNYPSDHPLAGAELNWREDRGILERICEHNVGHPDYDSAKYLESIGKGYENVHGCDGCCLKPDLRQVDSVAYDLVVDAINELKLQTKYLSKAGRPYDPTLYRAWAKAVIPTLIPILLDAEDALAVCTHPEDIAVWDNHVALAKTILGTV